MSEYLIYGGCVVVGFIGGISYGYVRRKIIAKKVTAVKAVFKNKK